MIEYIYPKSREEWLAERAKGIGSSEVGAVMGVSGFDTPYTVWLRKTGRVLPSAESPLMKIGHVFEGGVAALFADATGAVIDDATAADFLCVNDAEPFARASPDRFAYMPGGGRIIVECKTTQKSVSGDALPFSWFAQVQYQMYCAGMDRAAIAWLSRGRDFGFEFVGKDDAFTAYMLDVLREFWSKSIVGDEPPAPISNADAIARYPVGGAGAVEADAETAAALSALRAARQRMKEAEAEADDAEATIRAFMGDRDILTVGGDVVVTWKATKPRETLDSAALKKAEPELFAKFARTGAASRRFIVK